MHLPAQSPTRIRLSNMLLCVRVHVCACVCVKSMCVCVCVCACDTECGKHTGRIFVPALRARCYHCRRRCIAHARTAA